MGSWFSKTYKPYSMLFKNAHLVGHPDGAYNVLVTDGVVQRISKGTLKPDGAEVVDLTDKWLAPVSYDFDGN